MTKRFLGSFIILTGALLLLSNFSDIEFNSTFQYLWPSYIILFGIISIYTNKRFGLGSLIIIVIGLGFLLDSLDVLNGDLIEMILFPSILILIGVNLFIKESKIKHKVFDKKEYVAIFGGISEKNNSTAFEKSDIITIFGGAEIDFSNIKIKGNKGYVDITSIFGGVELKVPDDIKVSVTGLPVFGGAENTAKINNNSKKKLIINYTVIFGGIEIKN